MNLFQELCPHPIQSAFHDVDIRLVGGSVRDFLRNSPSQDIDFAVPITPSEIISRLKKSNIDYLLMGINFGTVTAIIEGKSFEITALRQDIIYTGRHPKVIYTTSFEEDALRRDFTFNALYMGKDNQLFDPFGGEKDLKNGIIKFIGNPYKRIAEDPLRILRFYRFFGKIASQMDPLSRLAAKESMPQIELLSRERIWSEFSKILMLNKRFEVLTLLKEDNFSNMMHICPNLKHLEQDNDISPLTIFASTGIDLKLNWSKKEAGFFKTLLKLKQQTTALQREGLLNMGFSKFLVKQLIYLRFLNEDYRYDELRDILKTIDLYTVPEFPIKGGDLLTLGIPEGRKFGEILEKIRGYWESDPGNIGYEKCLEMAKNLWGK